MDSIPLGLLFFILFVLFLLSAFFSGSETALMALNRYKLKHLVKHNKGARLASKLLEEPDRLIGLILLGNNLVNILITQLATLIGFRLAGNLGVGLATGALTIMLLIFAEVTPKTIAALKSEAVAFPSAYVYTPLLKVAYPLVWLINLAANAIVRLFGVDPKDANLESLNHEELKAVVSESGDNIPATHQDMLVSVLDMQSTTVEDIMIARTDVTGINIDDDWNDIEEQILHTHYTRLLIYQGQLDNVLGFVNIRSLLPLLHEDRLSRDDLTETIRPAYFTPAGTVLTQQLINFQSEKRRAAIVVDEYGEIQGIVTLEDIMEEIVGAFSPTLFNGELIPQDDGTIWVDGSMHTRELNRQLNIELPTDGAKTVNGLITEHLGSLPAPGVTVLINGYPLEIRQTRNNAVKTLILYPRIERYIMADNDDG
ncbi:magnesium/cobalt efflux protein [Leucothrix arctica]|uniref:Magnesium/cobalt efflux protein n=1 Tax=Leucothrix arctica TaxID=1481894 RepID=A0A317C7I8_9GAMM|nr:magnesium/cobalt efflux protein [Leucothrix arctica]